METAMLTVKEAAQILGIHYHTLYRAVKRGEIQSTKIGKRILIPKNVIDSMCKPKEV